MVGGTFPPSLESNFEVRMIQNPSISEFQNFRVFGDLMLSKFVKNCNFRCNFNFHHLCYLLRKRRLRFEEAFIEAIVEGKQSQIAKNSFAKKAKKRQVEGK